MRIWSFFEWWPFDSMIGSIIWQSSLCLAVALLASLACGRRSARAHAILVMGLVACLAMPALSVLAKQSGVGILHGAPQPSHRSAPSPANPALLDAPSPDTTADEARVEHDQVAAVSSTDVPTGFVFPKPDHSSTLTTAGATAESNQLAPNRIGSGELAAATTGRPQLASSATYIWRACLLTLWGSGAAILLARLAMSFLQARRLVRTAQPLTDHTLQRAANEAARR